MKATSAIVRPERRRRDPARLARRPTGRSSSASSSASRRNTSARPTRSTTSPATASSTTSPSAHFQAERSGQWTKGKSHDTFGPIGPWLVTKDEVAGARRTSRCGSRSTASATRTASTATMVYKVPFLVSYLSQFMSLQPGDIISTGTPPGRRHGPEAAGLPEARPDDAARHRGPGRAAAAHGPGLTDSGAAGGRTRRPPVPLALDVDAVEDVAAERARSCSPRPPCASACRRTEWATVTQGACSLKITCACS